MFDVLLLLPVHAVQTLHAVLHAKLHSVLGPAVVDACGVAATTEPQPVGEAIVVDGDLVGVVVYRLARVVGVSN